MTTPLPEQLAFDYAPRDPFIPFHQRDTRWACIVAHRRAGKTVACVNELVLRAVYSPKKNPRYAYIAPFYSQAKQVAWTYLKEAAQPFITNPRLVRESDLSVELFNGAVIRLYGADNPDALRGIYLDGAVLDEFGDCRPSLWGEVILPTLADRNGWAVFIGTPKGKNTFYDIYQRSLAEPNWFSLTLKATTSGLLSPSQISTMRAQMTEEQAAQELDCSFTAAVRGTYYAALIEQAELDERITTQTLYDPDRTVYAAFDIGYRDSTAIWFWQPAPDGLAIIDYEEDSAKPLQHYVDLLHDKPYRYERIYLPHDARAKTLQTGRSTVEQFLDADFPIDIAPHLKVQQGIDAVRLMLPRCHFDLNHTYAGIEALRHYRRKYDELTKAFANNPQHDWSSHGADAFRYLALASREFVSPEVFKAPAERIQEAIDATHHLTLDQMFQDRERGKGFQFERMRIH